MLNQHVPESDQCSKQSDHAEILELLRTQAEEIASLRQRLDRAESMVASARSGAPTEQLESPAQPATGLGVAAAASDPIEGRRTFLKLAGLTTAGGAAAALLRATPAAAADGDTVRQGSANDAANTTSTTTTVTNSGASGLAVAGLRGVGPSNSNGVIGTSNGSAGAGLLGTTDTGYGVIGSSTGGYALYAAGNGRIGLDSHVGGSAAPSSGTYQLGDILRDSTGNVWCCVVAGSPGTFRKVAGPSSAGSFHFLATPFRAYDSRPSGLPATGVKSPLVAVGARSLSLSSIVPAGTIGVALNVAVVSTISPGYLAVYATGIAYPGTSSVNWTTTGQIVSNFVFSAVSASASLELYCGQGGADVIVDVVGYFR